MNLSEGLFIGRSNDVDNGLLLASQLTLNGGCHVHLIKQDEVQLACLLAKKAKCTIHLIYIIEVPRTLPLEASVKQEARRAEALLAEAMTIANGAGCDVATEVVQVRDAAPAIIDEAKDHHCALIMLGQGRTTDHRVHNDVGKVIPYVLTHAPCRVWVIQDQQAA